jgi:hypothetical protein
MPQDTQGYLAPVSEHNHDKKEEEKNLVDLKLAKCQEMANSPMKSIPMTLFLLWVSGNQVNIFPIIITVMNIMNPIKAIFSVDETFIQFDQATRFHRIQFVFWNIVLLSFAIAKLHFLGLLPSASDFIDTSVPILISPLLKL